MKPPVVDTVGSQEREIGNIGYFDVFRGHQRRGPHRSGALERVQDVGVAAGSAAAGTA